jgi:hypothetical protein
MRGSATGASDCTVLAGFTPACKGALVESLASLLSSIFFRLRDMALVDPCHKFSRGDFSEAATEALRSIGQKQGFRFHPRQIWWAIREHAFDKPLTSGNVKSRTHLEE